MKKQTKANKEVEAKVVEPKVVESKVVEPKVVEPKVVEQTKSYRVPKCSVNFAVIEKFEDEMAALKLTRDSKVNDIMLALYAKHGTNLNPHVLANQIAKYKNVGKKPEDKDYCKCSANCISWYKNHYRPELNKFVSTKKKSMTKQELLDKLYAVSEIKDSPVGQFLPSLPLTKLRELVTNYELA